MTKTLAQIVGTIVDELTPLDPEERRRAVQAAMTLLGETPVTLRRADDDRNENEDVAEGLPPRVAAWMRQATFRWRSSSIPSTSQKVRLRSSHKFPGKIGERRSATLTCWQVGVANFLRTDEQRFDDAEARALCERCGAFDPTNHAKYMKGGNEFTGSRERGWTLTMPGLKAAADLIKEISA